MRSKVYNLLFFSFVMTLLGFTKEIFISWRYGMDVDLAHYISGSYFILGIFGSLVPLYMTTIQPKISENLGVMKNEFIKGFNFSLLIFIFYNIFLIIDYILFQTESNIHTAILSISLFGSLFLAINRSYYNVKNNMTKSNSYLINYNILQLLFLFVLSFFTKNIYVLSISFSSSMICFIIYEWFKLKEKIDISISDLMVSKKDLIQYKDDFLIYINILFNTILSSVPGLVIQKLLFFKAPLLLIEMNYANKFITALLMITTTCMNSLSIDIFSNGDKNKNLKDLKTILFYSGILMTILMLFIGAFGKIIIDLAYFGNFTVEQVDKVYLMLLCLLPQLFFPTLNASMNRLLLINDLVKKLIKYNVLIVVSWFLLVLLLYFFSNGYWIVMFLSFYSAMNMFVMVYLIKKNLIKNSEKIKI